MGSSRVPFWIFCAKRKGKLRGNLLLSAIVAVWCSDSSKNSANFFHEVKFERKICFHNGILSEEAKIISCLVMIGCKNDKRKAILWLVLHGTNGT